MTNEEQFKNELDWLKANYPLIGDHDFKLDSVVHVTVGRIAELLYEHAFGCGRLGAAVSASPQPRCPKCGNNQLRIDFNVTDGGKNRRHYVVCKTGEDCGYRAWVDDLSQFFAAAPAQEPESTLPLAKEYADRCVFECGEDNLLDGDSIAKRIEQALIAFGKHIVTGSAAQEQPVESHPKTATRMRDGKPVEIQNDPDVIHLKHLGPDCGEKDYPRPPKKA